MESSERPLRFPERIIRTDLISFSLATICFPSGLRERGAGDDHPAPDAPVYVWNPKRNLRPRHRRYFRQLVTKASLAQGPLFVKPQFEKFLTDCTLCRAYRRRAARRHTDQTARAAPLRAGGRAAFCARARKCRSCIPRGCPPGCGKPAGGFQGSSACSSR